MKNSPSACNACLNPKLSIISVLCRICYDNDKDEALIAPCHCKGTVAFVHRSCLERWLAESNTTMCELCHVVFRTERSPKYTSRESIWRWLKSHRTPGGIGRGVRSDIIACTVITPVAIVITYVCLFSSDYYNQKKFIMVPAARWTSVSLLIMIGIMLIGYYLWVYSVIRLHSRMWYNWWQRECVVRYIPPSTAHICCHNAVETVNPTNTPRSTPAAESPTVDDNEDARSRQDAEIEVEDTNLEQESEDRNPHLALTIEQPILAVDRPPTPEDNEDAASTHEGETEAVVSNLLQEIIEERSENELVIIEILENDEPDKDENKPEAN